VRRQIPSEFKDFFLTVSRYTYFNWYISEGYQLPQDIGQIIGGGIEIGLELIPQMNKAHEDLIEKYYNNSDSEYDQGLKDKFVFHATWSGDLFAIDLTKDNYGSVLYLSYNDSPAHHYVLGKSFS
jgi:hypothetical protein